MRLLVGPSRFRQWAARSGKELGSSAPPALDEAEARLARRWAAEQKEAWGWHLEVRPGPGGEGCLLAFSGAEDADVDWLIYRVEVGFQSDEWVGESLWSPTLEHALGRLAPVSEADSRVAG